MVAPPESAETASNGDLAPPSKLLLLLEGRAAGELLTTLALGRWLRRQPTGDGHPVLLLPGFLASDLSTRPLRSFLRHRGYSVHRWKLGRNLGPRDGVEAAMTERLQDIHQHQERKVSLVGWSLGGVYARELARHRPHGVRSLITLASPLRGSVGQGVTEVFDRELGPAPRTRPEAMTSLYSRSDGVVPWRACLLDESARHENVELSSSHCGMGHHPAALYVIADRLAQAKETWQPFEPESVPGWLLGTVRAPDEPRAPALAN